MSGDDHARVTYDAFARDYDAYTADHDYDTWMRDLETLAVSAGLRGRRLLDVACGTGKSFAPLLARGYSVTACDVSPAMVECARARAGPGVQVSACDMRALPMLGEFDLVTCLDDALNYLHTRDELVAAFSGIARNLARPGGVAVFDMNSLLAYETFFGALSVVAADGLVLVWRGRCTVPLAAGGFAEATIEALRRDDEGVWTTSSHDHRQRHHPREMVESALDAAGLRVLRLGAMRRDGTLVVDGFDEHEHTKAIYVVGHGGA